MPRRHDIDSILVIGSGPIVIGQACEFDYSGTQACRVLRDEGFRVILVNSNPATIMTDPEFADATYIEPITPEFVEMVIAKERPDALLATLGGQTALNTAVALHESGVLERYGVELIGASIEAIQRGENRQQFKAIVEGLTGIPGGPAEVARSRICHSIDDVLRAADDLGYPLVVRPSFTMGGVGSGFAHDEADLRRIAGARPVRQPDHRGADRGVDPGLEGVRARGHAGPGRQRGDRLLDREPGPDGRAHRRLDHRGARNDPDRPRVPADARCRDRHHPGGRGGYRRLQHPVRDQPGRRADDRDRDEPAGIAILGLASKATGFPIAKIAAKVAIGYTLDEIPNDITEQTPASFEPTLDYVVVKVPRFAFEKFPFADSTLTTHMKSVGEAMAIGRNFTEALGKALRSLEDPKAPFRFADEPTESVELNCWNKAARPHDGRLGVVMRALRAGATAGAGAPGDQDRPLVHRPAGAAAGDRRP